MTVAEMLSRMSARELIEWGLFYEVEPFGSEANFLGHAITASTVANANRGKSRAKKVEDFMPKFSQSKHKSPEEIFEALKMNLLRSKQPNQRAKRVK